MNIHLSRKLYFTIFKFNLGLLTENEQKIFEALDETYLQVVQIFL